MKYGICTLSIVPGRLEPSDRAEMVTQVLFGELYRVIDERKKWVKIRTTHDGYESWIDRKQHFQLVKEEFFELEKQPIVYAAEWLEILNAEDPDTRMPITLGSRLPNFTQKECSFAGLRFRYDGAICQNPKSERKSIMDAAALMINAPYLWGGRSPLGLDCSGYVQLVYRMAGIELPRDAAQQAEKGTPLSFIEEADPGDLAFFDNDQGNIIHVGILLANHHIIHASGKVRIDRIDHQGIYNNEIKGYSHHLRLITKILP